MHLVLDLIVWSSIHAESRLQMSQKKNQLAMNVQFCFIVLHFKCSDQFIFCYYIVCFIDDGHQDASESFIHRKYIVNIYLLLIYVFIISCFISSINQ